MTDSDDTLTEFNILPIGFPAFEKSTIASFFHLAQHRTPHWTLVDEPDKANIILFNVSAKADVNAIVSLVKPWQKAILVGSSDHGTGWPVIQRPLKLTQVLHALDKIVAQITSIESNAVIKLADSTLKSDSQVTKRTSTMVDISIISAPTVVDIPLDFKPITYPAVHAKPAVQVLSEAPSFKLSKSVLASGDVEKSTHLSTANQLSTLGKVLLVDDSDIALKFMQNLLRQFGYESDLASSGDEALAMLTVEKYHFVFLDVMMPGLDGYKTCRAIKTNKMLSQPSAVVMLTSRGGTIDKIRGSMAGCDAYLTKPLNQTQLAVVIHKFDKSTATQRWEALHPTAPLKNKYVELK